MLKGRRIIVGLALFVAGLVCAVEPGRAHKPITSPFTYNDDVFPILRDRCARCHVPEGVAPMSLMTYEDTVPWGESIRVELLSGHMPPWSVDAAPARFRNAQSISAREMNVLLTWATGGTPFGSPEKTPPPVPWVVIAVRPQRAQSDPRRAVAAQSRLEVRRVVTAAGPRQRYGHGYQLTAAEPARAAVGLDHRGMHWTHPG